MNLVKEHFNPRCSKPWNDADITHKWEEAGKPGAYPTLGVGDLRAAAKLKAMALQKEVRGFLEESTEPGGSISPTALLEGFLASRDGEAVSSTAYGRAFAEVTEIRSSKPGGRRMYQGISLRVEGAGNTLEPTKHSTAA